MPKKGKEVNFSISKITDYAKDSNITWVWDFIECVTEFDESAPPLTNLKHLRGAATRLLITNPNNSTILLLKAFSIFLLEDSRINSSNLVKEAQNDCIRGFSLFSDSELDKSN